MEYLADRFVLEQQYTEREVNDLLNQWHTFRDPVTLRREVYDNYLLNRDVMDRVIGELHKRRLHHHVTASSCNTV